MKRKFRILSLLLAAILSVGPQNALALDMVQSTGVQTEVTIDENEVVRAIVLFEDAGTAGAEQRLYSLREPLEPDCEELVETLKETVPELEVAHEFSVFFSGVSVDVPYGELSELENLDGVADVWITTTYSLPETEPVTAEGYYSAAATALGAEYTGQGTLIAVLDTGVNLQHEVFGVYEGVLGEPALTEEGAANADTSVTGAYVSEKIPFAYDYGDQDANVSDKNGHGTHVAAIAAGYAPAGSDDNGFSGAAPGAQLAIMKIFRNNAQTTTTDVYFAALEDAYLLGADVISMSLGSPCGFTHDANLDGALFGDIYEKLDEAGIILCAAVGNHGSEADHNLTAEGTVLAGYTDYGTVASPASYLGNTAVAAATNYENPSNVIYVDGTAYAYTEPTDEEGTMVSRLGGDTYEYALLEGYGTPADFAAADVAGKIAVVSRGNLSFREKVENASDAGAVALVIYNDQEVAVTMQCPDPSIPVIFVSKRAGNALKASVNKTIYVSEEQELVPSEEPMAITDFSAWGTTPDLTIAPAISGVGENVYAANLGSTNGYRYMSGTSMAAPGVAGGFAVILSYLRELRPELSKPQRAELAEALACSTADILGSQDEPVSVRQQGSGLMDPAAAVGTEIYLTEPLQELGDDPDETGVYEMTLELGQVENCPSRQFSDLDTEEYYHQAVDYGVAVGLFKGMSETKFAPNGSLTRGQMVTVIHRLAGEPKATGTVPFVDVESGAYYEEAVIWAYQCGVVKGVSETEFRPDSPITRQELVTILYRYLGSPETERELSDYVDEELVYEYARPAMEWAVANGIINSYSIHQLELNPLGESTRAQYATILYRHLKGEQEPESYALSAVVMADSAVIQEDGTITNLMEPQTIDCDVIFSCGDNLVLSPCESTTVTVTVRLTEETKAMLRRQFACGTYIEGYITMESTQISLHATFLSFFGDWEEAPILEQVDFRDVAEAEDIIDAQNLDLVYYDLVPVNMGANLAQLYCSDRNSSYYGSTIGLLGDNPFGSTDYQEAHMAITSACNDADETYAQQLVLQTMQLRNAKSVTMTVTDAQNGEVYHRDTRSYRSKSSYSEARGWKYSNTFYWTPEDASGAALPTGTEVIVTVWASLHGEPETEQWSFPVVIDSTAPAVNYSKAGKVVKLTVSDNEYLACISVCDASGNVLLEQVYSDETAGGSRSLTVDLSNLSGSITVTAVDYAMNVRQVEIPVS